MKMNHNFSNIAQSYLFSTVAKKVADYTAAHPDKKVIRLGIGDVTLPLPQVAIDAMHAAVDEQSKQETFHGYGPEQGYDFLKESIQAYYGMRDTKLELDEIFVSDGAKSDVGNILDLFDKDNTVLVPDPVYPVYVDTNVMGGRKIAYMNANESNGFLPLPDPSVKADIIYLCSPNNPTGAVMTKEELEAIAPIIIKHDILCLSDEVYSELTYGGLTHVSIASLPGMRERTFVFNGFSKGFAMTGWRIGYVCAPKEMMKQTMKVHQFAIMCAPPAGQYAANALLEDAFATDFAEVRKMVEEYDRKRKYLYKALLDMGLECFEPRGAFYMFPSVKSTGISGDEFSERLLMEKKVCIPAGIAFGQSGYDHIRISYAYAMDQIEKGAERMAEMVKELKANKK